MKIDRNIQAYFLTAEQKFFVLCWHNMVHARSLDSHRVRTMNSANTLRELLRLHASSIANDEDKNMVALEAHHIISTDPALRVPVFQRYLANFYSLYDESFRISKAKASMLQYYCTEFQVALAQNYIAAMLNRLKEILVTPSANGANTVIAGSSSPNSPPKPICDELAVLTGNLLSVLIDNGTSLESLFGYYRFVLVPFASQSNQTKYQFSRKFGLLEKLILQEPQNFRVVFLIHGISDVTTFPEFIGGISFKHASILLPKETAKSSAGKKFQNVSGRTLCAEVEVSTQDPRTAGILAYARLNDVMDLVRFEYEREKISIEEEFISITFDLTYLNPNSYKVFKLPQVVPNPHVKIDAQQLQRFVDSVNQLVSNGKFSHEGRDRVHSAFRLYRTGLDTNTFDNKFINWWTAIEYLVRDGESSGIGKSVENNIVPLLCLGYISKHILTYRNAIVDLGETIQDPESGSTIFLRELEMVDLYKLFKRPDMLTALLQSVRGDPYLHYKLEEFLQNLVSPKAIHAITVSHEKRLRWHVQRLWRTRCDIVHSGGQIVNAALLCANLEFYLKSTLTKLLQELRDITTLSTPKEFFERQKDWYQQVQADLQSGSDQLFIQHFDQKI